MNACDYQFKDSGVPYKMSSHLVHQLVSKGIRMDELVAILIKIVAWFFQYLVVYGITAVKLAVVYRAISGMLKTECSIQEATKIILENELSDH